MVVRSMMRTDDPKRMVKMLIVDDEPIICEGLRLTIDWKELGVIVVGEAYDGVEALRMTKKHGVDILLSDIRMEGMDGLKLAEKLKLGFPHVHVVMISGYEDFEYARQAMRLGVTDYLLKPVNIEELIRVVKGIVKLVGEEDQTTGIDEELDVLWLSGMVHQTPSYIQVTPPQQLQGVSYRVIVSQLMNFAENYAMQSVDDFQKVQQQWIQFLHDQLTLSGIHSIAVFGHRNLLNTLAISDQRNDDEYWRSLLEKTMQAWNGSSRLCCGVSEEYYQLEETADSSAEARGLLQYHMLLDGLVMLPADRFRIMQEVSFPEYSHQEMVRKLVSALFRQNFTEIKVLINELFDIFTVEHLLLHKAVNVYDELLVLLRQRIRQSGLTEIEHGRISPIDLNVNNSYASLKAIAVEEMRQLMQLIDHYGLDKSYWIIEKAKIYMTEHYHDDIKASEVSAWLKITPGYFSSIFKQSTGKSFKEYMNEMRIDDAKLLLATTHDKVFEIANKIGYKEYKYFVSVFKSYTGMTPKEYRSLNANR
jgi:two-component system response regulator YesN